MAREYHWAYQISPDNKGKPRAAHFITVLENGKTVLRCKSTMIDPDAIPWSDEEVEKRPKCGRCNQTVKGVRRNMDGEIIPAWFNRGNDI